jgi:hypothetical protein
MASCEICKFWDYTPPDVLHLEAVQFGLCRRRAPAVHIGDRIPAPKWPATQHSDWCGDFEKGAFEKPVELQDLSEDFKFEL